MHNIIWDSSDHLPFLVRASKNNSGRVGVWVGDDKPFKFKAKWFHVAQLKGVVSEAWVDVGKVSASRWSERMLNCGRSLDKWG